MTAKKIALFIDADNISAKFGKQIFDVLERRGEIFIRRIYGNWEKISLHGWNDCILSFSLRAVQQPDFVTGKNATDMSLTIDAMDVLHDGKAEVFALVSNDSDFTPLAIRLREGGMTVIGLGGGQVSNSFRAACNEFIDLSAPVAVPSFQPPKVVKKNPPAQAKSSAQMSLFVEDKAPASTKTKVVPITSQAPLTAEKKDLQPLHDALREAVEVYANEDGFANLCSVGGYVTQKLGAGIKNFGYGSLQKFLAAFANLYEVQKNEHKVFLRCRAPEPKEISDDRLEMLHGILRKTAETHVDATGFTDLSFAGNSIGKQKIGFGIRSLGYSTLQKFVCAFPDRYEIRKEQKKFFYRCRMSASKKISDDRLNRLHDILREAAAAHSDDAGFSLLNYAGQAIKRKHLGYGIKDFGYHQLRDFVADFPELYEIAQDNAGQKFRYRCR